MSRIQIDKRIALPVLAILSVYEEWQVQAQDDVVLGANFPRTKKQEKEYNYVSNYAVSF